MASAKNGTRKRKPKQTDIEDKIEERTPAPGGNGFPREATQDFVDRIENLHTDKLAIMSRAMNECKAVNQDIALVLDEAKDKAGIPKKALKKVIKARALERKAAEVREDLEGEDQDNFDLIRQALGDLADTPLGRAATPPDPSMKDPPFSAPADEPRAAQP